MSAEPSQTQPELPEETEQEDASPSEAKYQERIKKKQEEHSRLAYEIGNHVYSLYLTCYEIWNRLPKMRKVNESGFQLQQHLMKLQGEKKKDGNTETGPTNTQQQP